MAEVDDFLDEMLPRLRATEVALHEGDPGPRKKLWSTTEPVTLFGAEVDRSGRDELDPAFTWVASRFTACQSLEYDIIAAGASGDLAYLVAYEHISATVGGRPTSYSLRATTVFRREAGEWRVVHRHGDSLRA
ncbi:MAG: hypothetical protein AVDCRST_MAG32-1702 [uncultured Nocardioides sp.]|uniref:SnoaL-like domain-containing protein n=1 Tax=uncultured Nocardioides sp. TaxID=198441 RepID=A0A6J4NFX4_9ACTN|nr:MAG: hypothetical protein AVDCRST_MAG32-1702 [uncultured Nocardioides sp.]